MIIKYILLLFVFSFLYGKVDGNLILDVKIEIENPSVPSSYGNWKLAKIYPDKLHKIMTWYVLMNLENMLLKKPKS